jgi:hypothetical protein
MTNIPLEEVEQEIYTKWLDLNNILYFAVPNVVSLAAGLNTVGRRIAFWKKRRKEGVKKGVPDLVVFLPHLILFIEMKRIKKSYPSKEQKKWIADINLFPYTHAEVAKGGHAAIEITERLLQGKD